MLVNKQRQQEEIVYDMLLIPAVRLFLNNQFTFTVHNSSPCADIHKQFPIGCCYVMRLVLQQLIGVYNKWLTMLLWCVYSD